jgi:solute carrier family 25 carnitine/acylcarnitine transporter 20/29
VDGWIVALCGGLSGSAFWLGSHPLDAIKSKMQSDALGSGCRYATMSQVFIQTWKSPGLRPFYSGLGPALLRTFPSSAGTFAT